MVDARFRGRSDTIPGAICLSSLNASFSVDGESRNIIASDARDAVDPV